MRLGIDGSNEASAFTDRIMTLLGEYLSERPDWIDAQMMDGMRGFGMGEEGSYSLLLASALGLDPNGRDRRLYQDRFPEMIKKLDPGEYENDPYFRNVSFREGSVGNWSLAHGVIKPYEAFVFDDVIDFGDGRMIPRIGFFDRQFRYPAVTENGRIWMSVTPNEVNTMRSAIGEAFGRVLTFGLGLGYFQYMVSRKSDVTCVVSVERDPEVIRLFEKAVLPSFECPSKLRIVCSDAFDFADREFRPNAFDFVFTDIWLDASDGFLIRREMQKRERLMPNAVFRYWIEKTLDCYEDDTNGTT